MKNHILLTLTGLLFVTSSVQAESDYGQCYRLLKNNDNAGAIAPCAKAANRGDLAVQVTLGNIYEQGIGIDQDYGQAAKWFRQAAVAGDTTGQYLLGSLYQRGRGVPKDIVEAYAWMDVGTRYGDLHVAAERDGLITQMSSEQLGMALEKSAEYRNKYGQDPRKASKDNSPTE